MIHNGAKILQFTSYLNARVVDLIDGTLGRQANVLLDVGPVHEGQVDGTGDVGSCENEDVREMFDAVNLSEKSIDPPHLNRSQLF